MTDSETLDKALYDQAKIYGKIASAIQVAKLCTPEVKELITHRNILHAFDFIQSCINPLLEPLRSRKEDEDNFVKSIGIIETNATLILHYLSECPAASFVHEELTQVVALAYQKWLGR